MTYVKGKATGVQRVTQRMGTKDDAVFLALMDFEASLPPFEVSFWDELIKPTGSETLVFLEELFRQDASNWGNAEDFIILELDGEPAACCAVFRPAVDPPSEGPLNLDRLPQIAKTLGWSTDVTATFKAAYEKVWSGDTGFLKPQAEVIIETVAVAASARGHGLGHTLMKAAFERGRSLGAESIGIMVINGNDAAQSLYEKHFEPYATFHGAYFDHEFPGLTKYRATLATERNTPMAPTPNDTMIVMYNLAPDQEQAVFEKWLHEVDLPGYEKVSSMSAPVYYRAEETLEGEVPPFKYVVAIKSKPGEEVDEEMSGPEWEGFVADFENRTRDAVYVSATRIIG